MWVGLISVGISPGCLEHPISGENLAYASHIYPAHAFTGWDQWFGKVAETYPVISTEWGYVDENRADAPAYLAGSQADYGEPFLNYLADRGIGWVACWYDDEWLPPMFAGNRDTPTRFGTFVLEQLK